MKKPGPHPPHVSVTSRVPGEWKTFRRVKAKNEGSAEDYKVTYLFGADKGFIMTYEMTLLIRKKLRKSK